MDLLKRLLTPERVSAMAEKALLSYIGKGAEEKVFEISLLPDGSINIAQFLCMYGERLEDIPISSVFEAIKKQIPGGIAGKFKVMSEYEVAIVQGLVAYLSEVPGRSVLVGAQNDGVSVLVFDNDGVNISPTHSYNLRTLVEKWFLQAREAGKI